MRTLRDVYFTKIKPYQLIVVPFVIAKRYVTLNTEHVCARRSGVCGSVDEEDHVNESISNVFGGLHI